MSECKIMEFSADCQNEQILSRLHEITDFTQLQSNVNAAEASVATAQIRQHDCSDVRWLLTERSADALMSRLTD